MIRHFAASGFDKGWGKIDGFHQSVTDRTPRGVSLWTRVIDNERHLHGLLVEQFLLAHPVIAQIVAMIRGQHDHRVFHAIGLFQIVQQAPKLIIALLDQPHIGWDHLLAHLITLKRA